METTTAVNVDGQIPLEVRMLTTIISLGQGAEIMKHVLDNEPDGVTLVGDELTRMQDQTLKVIGTFLQEMGLTPEEFLALYEKTREDAIKQLEEQREKEPNQ